jgi:hypothetical protein
VKDQALPAPCTGVQGGLAPAVEVLFMGEPTYVSALK